MSAQIKDGGAVDVLADLQGVVRIAKAASLGVTGNKPRIERAEAAIAAVAKLIEAARHSTPHLLEELRAHDASGRQGYPNLFSALRPLLAALARVGGAK